MSNAIDPDLAKRVPEHGASVHDTAAPGDRLAPVNAVRREMDRHHPIVPLGHRIRSARANHAEHFEASRRILLLEIEPDRARVTAARLHDIGRGPHIQ